MQKYTCHRCHGFQLWHMQPVLSLLIPCNWSKGQKLLIFFHAFEIFRSDIYIIMTSSGLWLFFWEKWVSQLKCNRWCTAQLQWPSFMQASGENKGEKITPLKVKQIPHNQVEYLIFYPQNIKMCQIFKPVPMEDCRRNSHCSHSIYSDSLPHVRVCSNCSPCPLHLDHHYSRICSYKATTVFPFILYIWFSSLCFSLSFFMISGTVFKHFHYPSKRVHWTRSMYGHKENRTVPHIYARCQLVYLDQKKQTHTVCAERFSSNLRLHKKNAHETATGHIHFRFLQSVAIPIIFPPTWYLISNEPYRYWNNGQQSVIKLTALHSYCCLKLHRFSHSALHPSNSDPSHADGIVGFNHSERLRGAEYCKKFARGWGPGWHSAVEGAMWCYGFEGQWG